eukprot:1483966-Pyramimonas_sp.AAC.1
MRSGNGSQARPHRPRGHRHRRRTTLGRALASAPTRSPRPSSAPPAPAPRSRWRPSTARPTRSGRRNASGTWAEAKATAPSAPRAHSRDTRGHDAPTTAQTGESAQLQRSATSKPYRSGAMAANRRLQWQIAPARSHAKARHQRVCPGRPAPQPPDGEIPQRRVARPRGNQGHGCSS